MSEEGVRGPPSELRQRFRVTGRVQGVGFRWWTRRRALELGLRGFVRNHVDGSVEVEATGPAEAVERLRSYLADGPPGARVRQVAVEPLPDTAPLPSSFEIEH